ncbi:hypothetical protein HUT03_03935 [Candidatus Liberibacter africanus]|uniref:hypothetical protein n=1 Tax=Liberibacter africanus TaxID=34020 RepID=UPI000ACACA44|nr:hypothetical protein [Candidatus Liberibacter africanus]QTP64136.1 hypothetical protein HUT03_03935 [Candidatus Liberibacter africanus]
MKISKYQTMLIPLMIVGLGLASCKTASESNKQTVDEATKNANDANDARNKDTKS